MRHNVIETVMGAVVLVVAALFVYFAFETAQVQSMPGYNVSANFFRVGGLSVGSDVRVSGIKVGTVSTRTLDPQTYDAVITMSVSNDVRLPADTTATVVSEGPLGGKYVRLLPGTSKEFIASGGKIQKTESFRSLEDQVGEIIFLATSKPKGGS
jgi:phospholipid/cholesterol/gamma-HCH transport system substrate-binding protein